MTALQQNELAQSIAESATLAISAKAGAMRKAGKDVISLGAGEPDFDTAETVAAAGIEAIQSGNTRYTPASGTTELRAEAAGWLREKFSLPYAADQVMITAGAKPALHMALMVTINPGDTVLLLSPFWVSYPALVRTAGGKVEELPAVPGQGFVHSGDQIREAAKRSNAKGIILNFPNNPSGAVATREQMQDIVQACLDCNLWILSDEIYASILYDGNQHVSPAQFEAAVPQTLVINGGTKSHSMTGWRVGFMAGPTEIIAAAGRLQSQVIGNPCTISQAACRVVCTGDHTAELQKRLTAYDERRNYLIESINQIPGLALSKPGGAFYALVDARELCRKRGVDDMGLAEQLLEQELLSVVPGSPFAIPGFFRISYATSLEELQRSVERLQRFAQA